MDSSAHWAIFGQMGQQLLGFQLPLQCASPLYFGPVMQHGHICEHLTVHVPWTLFRSLVPGQLGMT